MRHTTNLRMCFLLPYEGSIWRKGKMSWWKRFMHWCGWSSKETGEYRTQMFPEGCQIQANILSEDKEALTLDLEFVGDGEFAQDGDRMEDVPLFATGIHLDDVYRVTKEIAASN